jgi:hypothetical protein
MDNIKDSLIYYYIYLKTNIVQYYNTISRKISDVQDIKITTSQTDSPKSVIYRYYLLRILNWMSFFTSIFFNKIRDHIDIEANRIEIIKKYENGDKRIILDSNKDNQDNQDGMNSKIKISDIINYVDAHSESVKDDNLGDSIFLKCELCTPEDNICLKEYLLKYRDFEQKYHNTLDNILAFNNIAVPKNTTVKICKYKGSKRLFYEVSYSDIYDNHINYFFELD